MRSFSDIMQSSPKELVGSKVLPAGVYNFEVTSAGEKSLSKDMGDQYKEGEEYLAIYVKPIEAVEVDEEELEACENWRDNLLTINGGFGPGIFKDKLGDIFLDSESETGFVYDCGIDPGDYETVREIIETLVGKRFRGIVSHSANKKDPDHPFVNLEKTSEM